MVEYKDIEVLDKTKPLATDILLKFVDNTVSEHKYKVMKPKINEYVAELPPEWKMISDTQYNRITKSLIIGIIITIPDRFFPKGNFLGNVQIFADHIKGFREFYERLEQQFDMNK